MSSNRAKPGLDRFHQVRILLPIRPVGIIRLGHGDVVDHGLYAANAGGNVVGVPPLRPRMDFARERHSAVVDARTQTESLRHGIRIQIETDVVPDGPIRALIRPHEQVVRHPGDTNNVLGILLGNPFLVMTVDRPIQRHIAEVRPNRDLRWLRDDCPGRAIYAPPA